MLSRQQIELQPLRFNGTSSIITLPTTTPHVITAGQPQSFLTGVYPRGYGGGSLGYVWTTATSGAISGVRLLTYNPGSGLNFVWASSTTGHAGDPAKYTGGLTGFNNYYDIGGTYDGGLLHTGMELFAGINGRPLEIPSGISGASGSVAVSHTDNDLTIGNRPGAARTFDGDIYYLLRWNRIVSLAEMQTVQKHGLLAARDGLIFAWFNGRDWGPFGLNPSAVTAVAQGVSSPFAPKVSVGRRRYTIAEAAAAASFQPAWAANANAVIQSGVPAA